MNVRAVMFMILSREITHRVLHQGPLLKICRMIGPAPHARQVKISLLKWNSAIVFPQIYPAV